MLKVAVVAVQAKQEILMDKVTVEMVSHHQLPDQQ